MSISRRLRLSLGASAALWACLCAAPASARDRAPALLPLSLEPFAASAREPLAEAARWLGSANMTGTVGPWCADFVSFVLRRVGRAPLANRLAASALAYGPRLAAPRAGALAVMRTRRGIYGHVGFVEGIEPDGSIRLISGNWGHRVARSRVARGAIVAFVGLR